MTTKTVSTTKNLPFEESARLLFCSDCKKQFPGCKPVEIEVEDTWLGAGWKHKFKLKCKGKAEV